MKTHTCTPTRKSTHILYFLFISKTFLWFSTGQFWHILQKVCDHCTDKSPNHFPPRACQRFSINFHGNCTTLRLYILRCYCTYNWTMFNVMFCWKTTDSEFESESKNHTRIILTRTLMETVRFGIHWNIDIFFDRWATHQLAIFVSTIGLALPYVTLIATGNVGSRRLLLRLGCRSFW